MTEAQSILNDIMHIDRALYLEMRDLSSRYGPDDFAHDFAYIIGNFMFSAGQHRMPEECRQMAVDIWHLLRPSAHG